MANLKIHTIKFLYDNPYGEFVAGDILDVYLDTDDALAEEFITTSVGVTVEKNGSPLASSSTFITTRGSGAYVVSFLSYNVRFCKNELLITTGFEHYFPFGQYVAFYNPSCEINTSVCNLIVDGQPEVVNATGDLNADGQITVTATSSNPIQYSLEPFIYGSGQSSGTFTGLLPGTYRIWIKDSNNCSRDVSVTIRVDYAYGDRFILEYKDLKGFQTKVLVKKKDYIGVLDEICGSGSPFSIDLRGEGSGNKFEPLLSTKGTIQLLSRVDSQFLEFYTNDPNLYIVEYWKDFGAGYLQYWTGKILPNQYSESYKFPPYYVDVVATDGLPELRDFFLMQEDGQRYEGEISLIKLIAQLLQPLGLGLDILVACNLYAEGMDSTDSDDPFDQSYIDYEVFYLQSTFPPYDFILTSLLEPFGCRIVQWENRWNIIRVEELRDSFDYRIFDYNGDYVSNGTYQPVQSVGSDLIFVNPDQFLEIRPGFGNIRVNYILGLKPNILKNGDFRLKQYLDEGEYKYEIDKEGWTLSLSDYSMSESYENIDTGVAYVITAGLEISSSENGGEAYILSESYNIKQGIDNQIKISIRLKVNGAYDAFFGVKFRSQLSYVKVRMIVQYGLNYLAGDGTWTTTENEVIFYLTTTDEFQQFEIIAYQPTEGDPDDGEDFNIKLFHPYPYHAQFHTVASLEAFQTYSTILGGQVIPTGYKTELRVFPLASDDDLYYYELEETTDAEDFPYVIEPDDYATLTNERKWVLKNKVNVANITVPVAIDFIKVQFLHNKQLPFDTIIRTVSGEKNNKSILEKNLILGSSGNLIETEDRQVWEGGEIIGYEERIIKPRTRGETRVVYVPIYANGQKPVLTTATVTTNILAYELIYAGFLRDSSGEGYELWTRDGYAESDKLHGIFLQQYAGQYKRSWRLLRGSIRNKNSFFGLLNTLSEAGFIYLPISLTLDDKQCITNGEFLELMDSNPASTSSGFTSGFKQIAYR